MSLARTLKIASHLARCGEAIRKLKNELALEDEEQIWVFNLFNMNWDSPFHEDRGKISFMIFEEDKDIAKTLLSLSDNIASNSLTKENWEFILNGLLRYRRYLLDKSHACNYGCDI